MKNLNKLQLTLLILIYLGMISCIILSIGAITNIGQEGYDRCMERICTRHEAWCTKFRTKNNCCMGSGGDMVMIDDEYVCRFES